MTLNGVTADCCTLKIYLKIGPLGSLLILEIDYPNAMLTAEYQLLAIKLLCPSATGNLLK